MSVVSSPSRKKSWQTAAKVVSLLDALSASENEVAQRIARLRQAHGLSQEAAAHKAGVSNRQWQRWEAGDSEPHGSTLIRVSESFGVSIGDILGEGDETQMDRIEASIMLALDGLTDLAERVKRMEAAAAAAATPPARGKRS